MAEGTTNLGEIDESSSEISVTPRTNIYHERQSKQLCALHALNNLFQDPKAFTKQDLDAICKELAPDHKLFNPHKSTLGLGCYDVNVIISALSKKNLEVVWFDKRKELTCLDLNSIFGFILNVPNTPSSNFFALPLHYIPMQAQIWSSQRHWVALRKLGQYYYNLDSKLTFPDCIGTEKSFIEYLQQESLRKETELLIVVAKCISEDQSWLKKKE